MDNKKRVAAVSAVVAFIKSQEEAAAYYAAGDMAQGPAEDAQALPGPCPRPFSAWGISGRQAQMDGRFLMQMRTFR